jgi:HPt (histidine-containing phosphotransfer) domain-containing protein
MTDSTHSTAGDETDLPATDTAALARLKQFGGGKLLGEMITLFLTTAAERISVARAALESQDANATEMAMHSLKSSSAQLGALRMQRLCEKGEKLAHDGSLDLVAPLIDELEKEFPRVQGWLERSRTDEVA